MLRRMIGLHVRSRRDLLTTIPLLLLVTGVTALHAVDRPVELSRIRFRINGESYHWDRSESVPVVSAGQTQPRVLLSYTALQPGERYQPSEIERRAADWQRRLEATGVFYQVAVSVIPPNRYPDRRTVLVAAFGCCSHMHPVLVAAFGCCSHMHPVLVAVEDGFRQGFGGGSIYGYWTARNLRGRGGSVEVWAGANIARIRWNDRVAMGRRGTAGLRAGYRNGVLVSDDPPRHRLSGGGEIGYRVTPDISAYLGSDLYAQRVIGADEAEWGIDLRPVVGVALLRILRPLPPVRPTLTGRVEVGALISLHTESAPNPVAAGMVGARVAAGRVHARVTAAAGWTLRGTPRLFENDLSLNDLDNTAIVRAGWHSQHLRAESFGWAGIELGSDAFTVGRTFPVTVRPFLFSDQALLFDLVYERRSGDTRYADAYGAGLELIFDNPVNVTFELSAGINYQGGVRIVFRQELTL